MDRKKWKEYERKKNVRMNIQKEKWWTKKKVYKREKTRKREKMADDKIRIDRQKEN